MRGSIEIGLALPSRGPLARRAIESAVETLARSNEAYLRSNPDTPLLAQSGVRYQREKRPKGAPERWQGIAEIIREGFGDCEDLAAWAIAEARVKGIPAKPFVKRGSKVYDGRWHIMVELRKNGKRIIYDPSKMLGM